MIDASIGDDTVASGFGDDKTIISGFSTKTLSDDGGVDTLDFSGVTVASADIYNGVTLNLSLDAGELQLSVPVVPWH